MNIPAHLLIYLLWGDLMKKQQSFITGAIILTATALLVRMSGFLFRIYLSNTVGAQGMGIYSLIMSVYGLCTTIATSGISVAVSRLVAEQISLGKPENANRVLVRSIWLSVILGCSVGIILFVVSEPVAVHILGDKQTLLSIRILAPGLPFLSVSSCLRGYFIAYRKTGNPAFSQMLEQGFKIIFIVLLLPKLITYGLDYACALIVLGLTLGEIVCFLYTFAGYLIMHKQNPIRKKAGIKGVTAQIFSIIVPISLASYIRSGLRLLENVIIMNGLRTYSGANDSATGIYGMLKGMAMPLLIFPLSLLSSFVITLTPEISRLHVSGRKQTLEATVGRILKYTCYAGVLIVCVFITFPREISLCIYNDEQVGEMLLMLSFLSPFMCLETVIVGILQGLGEQSSSSRYNVVDCFLRIAIVCMLVPTHGVTGFLWMTGISNLFTSIMNIRRLLKVTAIDFHIKNWFIKPAIAAAASSQLIRLWYLQGLSPIFSQQISLALGITAICIAYFALLIVLDCIDLDEVLHILRRFNILPERAAKYSSNEVYD